MLRASNFFLLCRKYRQKHLAECLPYMQAGAQRKPRLRFTHLCPAGKIKIPYLSASAASALPSTAGISLASSLFSSAKRLIFIVLVFANCPDLISSLRMHL